MNRTSFVSISFFILFFSHINVNALSAQTFTRITTGSIATDAGLSQAATWSDYNNDGNVDLFVPNTIFEDNFLYLNNGDGTFTKILSSTIVNDGGNAQTANSETATWGDFDNDGDLDVFISYGGPNNQYNHIDVVRPNWSREETPGKFYL